MRFTILNLMMLTWVVINGCMGARQSWGIAGMWHYQFVGATLLVTLPLVMRFAVAGTREYFERAEFPWHMFANVLLGYASILANAAGYIFYGRY